MIRFVRKTYSDVQEILEPAAIGTAALGTGALLVGEHMKGSEKRKFKAIEKAAQKERAAIDKLSKSAIKERVKNHLSKSAKYAKGKKWTRAGLAGLGVGAGVLGANELILRQQAK